MERSLTGEDSEGRGVQSRKIPRERSPKGGVFKGRGGLRERSSKGEVSKGMVVQRFKERGVRRERSPRSSKGEKFEGRGYKGRVRTSKGEESEGRDVPSRF